MKKIITLSFDDGVTQDRKLIQLLKKYNLKATFNLNSSLTGVLHELKMSDGTIVSHNRVDIDEVKTLYEGFEIASHTRTHPMLTQCSPEKIAEEVIGDRLKLSELTGYPVIGFAYPGRHPNYDRLVVEIMRLYTGVCYCRTIESTNSLAFPQNYYIWNPSLHILDERVDSLIDCFVREKTDCLLYLWGHIRTNLILKTAGIRLKKYLVDFLKLKTPKV